MLMISAEQNLSMKIQQCRKKDDDLKPIFEILATQQYDFFIMRKGVLYKQKDGSDLIVVPKRMEVDVIRQYHENGHFGVKRWKKRFSGSTLYHHCERESRNASKIVFHYFGREETR